MGPDEVGPQILAQIRAWLRQGRIRADQLDEYVSRAFPGQYENYEDLVRSVYQAGPEAQADEAAARVGRMGTLGRAGRAALGGIPFADEAIGLVNPDAAQTLREDQAAIREMYGGPAMAMEMAGGMLLPGGVGLGAARGLAARGLGPIASRVLGGAAGGAVGGGVFGLGEGQGAGDRLQRGAVGAGAGAFGGAVLSGGGVAGTRALARGLSSGQPNFLHRAASSLSRLLGGPEILTEAQAAGRARGARILREAVEENDAFNPVRVGRPSTENLFDAASRIDPENAVPADLGGGLAGIAGASRDLAPVRFERPGGPVEAIRDRAFSRGARVGDAIREITGAGERFGPVRAAQELRDRAQEQFYGPLDETFTNMTLDDIPNVRYVLENMDLGGGRTGLDELNKLMKRGDTPPGRLNFRTIQDLRRRLRNDADKARRDGDRNLMEDLNSYVRLLGAGMEDDFGPEFAQADRLWRRGIELEDSYNMGADLANRSLFDIERALKRRSPEDRAAMTAGMLDRLLSRVAERDDGGAAVRQMMRAGGETREKLKLLMGGSEMRVQQLENVLQREAEFQRTMQFVAGGSPTSFRQSAKAAIVGNTDLAPSHQAELYRRVFAILQRSPAATRETAVQLGEALLGNREAADALFRASRGDLSQLDAMLGAGAATQLVEYLTATDGADLTTQVLGILSAPAEDEVPDGS